MWAAAKSCSSRNKILIILLIFSNLKRNENVQKVTLFGRTQNKYERVLIVFPIVDHLIQGVKSEMIGKTKKTKKTNTCLYVLSLYTLQCLISHKLIENIKSIQEV